MDRRVDDLEHSLNIGFACEGRHVVEALLVCMISMRRPTTGAMEGEDFLHVVLERVRDLDAVTT